ncbi:cytochrome P450 monooxygenase [Apiospora kogelbergensis]|uniref:cytochrome P450 monooxygenase n=1 Tax=Apiospora kogelbergensis TaxID=1337665 RepID=UPI00313015A9
MLVDNWPIVPPMAVIASHQVAEQISKPSNAFPYSAPKSWSLDHAKDLIGHKSILIKQDAEWKAIRRRFNAGFAPQHLMTLLPVILEKMDLYIENIDAFVRSGETFSLDEITTNLTFDVIGAVSVNESMDAQYVERQGDLVCTFKQLMKTFVDDKLQFPWWVAPLAHLRRRRLGQLISRQLRDIVHRSFTDMKSRERDNKEPVRLRTIVALSLQDIDSLTPEVMEETCDQLKTFLFAGHDTTSAVLDWAIYELFRTPHALKGVHDELDALFGRDGARDPAIIKAMLLAPGGNEIVHRMQYISAVLKETLRLHSPAGSIRVARPGSGFVVSTPEGGDYSLDGCWLYLNHNIIHRDPAVYGNTANDFIPERWLASATDAPPASAWRPFERGPRNCIGQELANIELRILVAMLARRYDFTKIGLGELDLDKQGRPILGKNGQLKVNSEVYNTFRIAGKPVDGMLMKVKLASTAG